MSRMVWKEKVAKYFKEHGKEIICSLVYANGNTDAFEAYFENYLQMRK